MFWMGQDWIMGEPGGSNVLNVTINASDMHILTSYKSPKYHNNNQKPIIGRSFHFISTI
jgi:hypothetical protein